MSNLDSALHHATGLLEILQASACSKNHPHHTLTYNLNKHLQASFTSLYYNKKLTAHSQTTHLNTRSQELLDIKHLHTQLASKKNPLHINPEHTALRGHLHNHELLFLPIPHPHTHRIAGSLLIAYPKSTPIPSTTLHFLSAAQSHLSAHLTLLETQSSSTLGFLKNRLTQELFSKKPLYFTAATAALIGLLNIPLPYKIKADAELEPTTIHNIAAPFNATLKTVLVQPGDLVQAGTPLAKLDEEDLISKKAELHAALSQSQKQLEFALAHNNPTDATLAQLESEKLSAQITLLNKRQNQLIITAPETGVILAGDLKKLENTPLSTGDPLFQTAPLDSFKLLLHVHEEDLPHLHPGQPVELHLKALPKLKLSTTLHTIRPTATPLETYNAFTAEAPLPNQHNQLSPGMKGRAKITTTEQPLYWILSHNALDHLEELILW